MKDLDFKRLIIREGMLATYNDPHGIKRVIISNIEQTKSGTMFCLRDAHSNLLLKKNGMILKLMAEIVIKKNIVILDSPIYLEKEDVKEVTIDIDINKAKRDELREFYSKQVKLDGKPFALDDEQLNAILSNKNTLVTARAGSGKTRVLVAKAIDLFENQDLNQTQVLAFCFNHDASLEICDRLNNRCLINDVQKYLDYDIAKTFHSFAKKVYEPTGILAEDKSKLIKAIITYNRKNDNEFSSKVYRFFRNETLRIDRKRFESSEDYFKYVRNCDYTTLNGEKVKSRQEKYIADYLFEHGIDYIYEKSFYPSKINLENAKMSKDKLLEYEKFLDLKKETKPDFYIVDNNLVWEHWAVNGNETDQEKLAFNKAVGDYDEYLKNQSWKRKFWDKNWINTLSSENKYNKNLKQISGFIQTYSRELKPYTRMQFESYIEDLLKNYHIYKTKLPENILIEKVWLKSIDSFTLLIEQFINKTQQNYFDNLNALESRILEAEDERTKIFCELGLQVYKQYLDVLNNNNNTEHFSKYNHFSIDFNQLIYKCGQYIIQGNYDSYIKQLKWILIDEYQDFSRLFNYLIDSILSRNQDIKLFCVGDDWQAINRFAGSDIKYFKTFTTRYENSKALNIRTNYRSESQIVNFANMFMDKCGIDGERPVAKSMGTGQCKEIDVSEMFIGRYDDNNIYLKYLDSQENNKYEKARYLKACSDIIRKNLGKKIMILNRSNQILYKDLDRFEFVLKNICSEFMDIENFKKDVQVKTVHKSKGEEAEIVILLNINENVFPVSNSNNALFEVFGENLEDNYEDEQRLYYVALTRAKQDLYILYDKGNKSEFIMY